MANSTRKHGGKAGEPRSSAGSDALEALLRNLREAGDRAVLDGTKLSRPEGLSPKRLARLELPNGQPVSGSLARWLGYSHDWLELVRITPRKVSWSALPLEQLLQRELKSYIEGDVQGLVEDIVASLPATGATLAAPLPPSASQCHFMLLLHSDAHDYPVFAMEKESAWMTFASFGDYLDSVVVPDPSTAPRRRSTTKQKSSAESKPEKRKRAAPRRSRLKQLETEAARALDDDALVDYGIKLAELGKQLFRMYYLTDVVALLDQRELYDGLYRVMRTHYECAQDARIRLLAPMARMGVRYSDPYLCEHAIHTFIKEARRDPTDLYSQFSATTKALAEAGTYLGGDHTKLFDAVERTIGFDGPTFARISPHPFYEPLWQRESMQARYAGLCRKQLDAISKKNAKRS